MMSMSASAAAGAKGAGTAMQKLEKELKKAIESHGKPS
jgi:hypothetical protein